MGTQKSAKTPPPPSSCGQDDQTLLRNLHRRFDRYCIRQIYGGDFTKNCGLLIIYEL